MLADISAVSTSLPFLWYGTLQSRFVMVVYADPRGGMMVIVATNLIDQLSAVEEQLRDLKSTARRR
jgi:hypothetical protein